MVKPSLFVGPYFWVWCTLGGVGWPFTMGLVFLGGGGVIVQGKWEDTPWNLKWLETQQTWLSIWKGSKFYFSKSSIFWYPCKFYGLYLDIFMVITSSLFFPCWKVNIKLPRHTRMNGASKNFGISQGSLNRTHLVQLQVRIGYGFSHSWPQRKSM